MTRDFAVSIFIYHNGKVLLHKHKKLNCWLPVGGHIDKDELPQEAAFREVSEECGLDIEICTIENSLKLVSDDVVQLVQPSWFLLENIETNHQHIDFVYMAKSKNNLIRTAEGESKEFAWVNKDNIVDFECPENVRKLVPKVIEHLQN